MDMREFGVKKECESCTSDEGDKPLGQNEEPISDVRQDIEKQNQEYHPIYVIKSKHIWYTV